MDEPVDLKKLAQEAAQTAYDPRAKRCWLFHQWSMWRPTRADVMAGNHGAWHLTTETVQTKRCVRCGLTKKKDI